LYQTRATPSLFNNPPNLQVPVLFGNSYSTATENLSQYSAFSGVFYREVVIASQKSQFTSKTPQKRHYPIATIPQLFPQYVMEPVTPLKRVSQKSTFDILIKSGVPVKKPINT